MSTNRRLQLESNPLQVESDDLGKIAIIDAASGQRLFDGLLPAYQLAEGPVIYLLEEGPSTEQHVYEAKNHRGQEMVITAIGDAMLRWTLRLPEEHRAVLFRVELANKGDRLLKLKELILFASVGENAGLHLDLADEVRCLRCLPHSWRNSELYFIDGTSESQFVTAAANRQNAGLVAGFTTFKRFLGRFELTEPERGGAPITISAFHRFEQERGLLPGETLCSEWVYLDPTDNVLTSLEAWADFTGQANDAVFSTPKASGFYTWYHMRENVSEELLLRAARFFAANRDRFPVNYIQMDSGWQRDYSVGETETTENFPHGLAYLAQEIRKLGFIPGLWVNAFMADYPTARVVKERPEIFQKDEAGRPKPLGEPIRNIMGRNIPNMHTQIRPGRTYHIDSTNPEAREYLKERFRWVKSMGYGQVMLDFLDAGLPAKDAVVFDPSLTEIEAERAALEAVREALGDEVMILASGAYYLPMIGIGNIVRTASDIPAHWKYVSKGCHQQLMQYFMHDRLFTAYADAMVLRDKPSPYWDALPNLSHFYLQLSLDEARFYTAVTGLSGITVWIAEDVGELAPERQWLLSLMLPIYDAGRFRPVDLFERYYPKNLELKLNEGGREWTVAAGLNWENQEVRIALELARLDLDPAATYHAFDVFEQRYLGQVAATQVIGPARMRSGRVINLVRIAGHPQVVGTDLHITQGAVEIGGERWDEDQRHLNIDLNDLEGRKGHLWIWAPSELALRQADGLAAEEVNCSDGRLYRLSVALEVSKTVALGFNRAE